MVNLLMLTRAVRCNTTLGANGALVFLQNACDIGTGMFVLMFLVTCRKRFAALSTGISDTLMFDFNMPQEFNWSIVVVIALTTLKTKYLNH